MNTELVARVPKYVGGLPHKALCWVAKDPFSPTAAAARNKLHIIHIAHHMYVRTPDMYIDTSCLNLESSKDNKML